MQKITKKESFSKLKLMIAKNSGKNKAALSDKVPKF